MDNTPEIIRNWVQNHKGWRTAVYIEGAFENYANSRSSACWGQPIGGIKVGEYLVAVCQPSPRNKGDIGCFCYDFVKN